MSAYPGRELKRPKPIIHKFSFSPEEQEDIKSMLQGKKSAQQKRNEAMGLNKYVGPNHRSLQLGTFDGRLKSIRLKYFQGGLCQCGNLPAYRVLYDMGGAWLKEHYCEQHFKESGIET